jgi:hypothetical protein
MEVTIFRQISNIVGFWINHQKSFITSREWAEDSQLG